MKSKLLKKNTDFSSRWIVSYADFVTMLLALFMVMYALSQMDVNNLKEFSSSVGAVFDSQENLSPIEEKKTKQNQSLVNVFKTTQSEVVFSDVDISSQEQQLKKLEQHLNNMDEHLKKEAVEFENIKKNLDYKLKPIGNINITREIRGLLIRLNDTILFDSGSDIIKKDALVLLTKLGDVLKEIPNSIKIEGHTDNTPINTKNFPSNWELSTARSNNIVKYFVNIHKLDPRRFSSVGYGEYMPISDNVSIEAKSKNRRVDIVILSTASKIFEPVSFNNN